MGSPYTATASVLLTKLAGTASADLAIQFDSSKLTNTFRVPIEIREIRFTSRASFPTRVSNPLVSPSFVYLEGKIGKDYLSDEFIPMAVWTPYRLRQDGSGVGGGNDYDDIYRMAAAELDDVTVSTRRMILRRPMYLIPGKGFRFAAKIPTVPNFESGNFAAHAFTARVYVTIVGRFMDPHEKVPEFHHVPIISHTLLRQAKRISLEDELRNPLSKPITVHHIVGNRLLVTADDVETNAVSLRTTVGLSFPDDSPFAEDQMEFPLVFGQMRAWPTSFVMKGNERITARLSDNATEDDTAIQKIAYQVSLVGSRQEFVR